MPFFRHTLISFRGRGHDHRAAGHEARVAPAGHIHLEADPEAVKTTGELIVDLDLL